ncbi:MAG TPA: G5 domain-containing protein [Anaerolineales bacterium]|nr:G5 domain-containing protein [Anaerolineales bacterium]
MSRAIRQDRAVPGTVRDYTILILVALSLAGCTSPKITQSQISVQIEADGEIHSALMDAGSTVQDALTELGIEAGSLDRVEPQPFTLLADGMEITLVRVEEEFVVEEVIVPFGQQVLRNESLPEGETRLIQPGVNGLEEITYRKLFEDGVEVSNSRVKSSILQEPMPEIVMVGSQSPFAAIPIPGKLVYLSGGNAWVMEGSTGTRRPIVTTGDLDGRIFRLSPDGASLLFTRASTDPEAINSLWIAPTGEEGGDLLDLEVENVIHFADWSPRSSQILAYSSVEPRETAPGWQANNDLNVINLNAAGLVSRRDATLEANSGGIYGWWGTDFAWSPEGLELAYARPDGIGLLDLDEGNVTPLLDITPLQTNSDWAWVPGLSWSPDGNTLFTVDHSPPQGVVTQEESPLFDLKAFPLLAGGPVSMVPEVGMFAYPVSSPLTGEDADDSGYRLAYLQSIFPTQSDTSRYRLVVMDRDGSNRRELFPPAGAAGLDPQRVVWSPFPLTASQEGVDPGPVIALVYQGNLWLVDAASGEAWQLTGDGLTSRLDWK